MKILCLGGSYTGMYLARNFPEAQVTFLARDPERLVPDGFRVVPQGSSVGDEPVDLVLDTVPTVKLDGKIHLPYQTALEPLMSGPDRPVFLHISTTSVYPSDFTADREDDLPTQDEGTEAGPDSDRAKDRLLLERAITSTYADARILRSGGIYGPGRCVATRFRDGDFARTGAGNRMVTRIHVHDLCRLILAFGKPDVGIEAGIVNAVDERSSSNRDTFAYCEDVLGVTVPGDWRTAAPQGRSVVSRYASSLLGGEYRFPTFKEGFADCLGI
jgi:nucleoside-diphosphate-sugar epimerase